MIGFWLTKIRPILIQLLVDQNEYVLEIDEIFNPVKLLFKKI